MKFLVPSKTFLVGEYSVLLGGAAIGLATSYQFEIEYLKKHKAINSINEDETYLFHPLSPAGNYLKNPITKSFFSKVQLDFKDPYFERQVKGGFGKSTAEYFSAVLPEMIFENKSIQDIWQKYREEHTESVIKPSVMPSGFDLFIQYYGQVACIDVKNSLFQSNEWNVADLDFIVLSTGFKINTHEHLAQLNLNRLNHLPELSESILNEFLNLNQKSKDLKDSKSFHNSNVFIEKLKNWTNELIDLNLCHPDSMQFKTQIEKQFKEIKLVKPCGALGADVMLLFVSKDDFSRTVNELQINGYQIQATSKTLVQGLNSYIEHNKNAFLNNFKDSYVLD